MAKIYLSAPFFSDQQIAKVAQLEAALKANPTVEEFVSPRSDSDGSGHEQGTYAWAASVYKWDIEAVRWCDATIEILDFDDNDTDAGTAYEMGFAKALGKSTMTISFDDYPVNLMLGIGSDYHFQTIDEIKHHDFNRPASRDFDGILGN